MSIYTSDRERRLWIWTFLVVSAIYSTIFLASVFGGILQNQDLQAILFVLGMLLVSITVLTQALRIRPRGIEIGAGIGLLAVYFMIAFRMTSPIERSHVFEYGVLAVLLFEALSERRRNGSNVPMPALFAIAGSSIIGVLDESIQWFSPARVFDPEDVAFNFIASTMTVVSVVLLSWVRRRDKKRRSLRSTSGVSDPE